MSFPAIDSRTCIVRDTAAHQGTHAERGARARRPLSYLHYGRIILDAGQHTLRSTPERWRPA